MQGNSSNQRREPLYPNLSKNPNFGTILQRSPDGQGGPGTNAVCTIHPNNWDVCLHQSPRGNTNAWISNLSSDGLGLRGLQCHGNHDGVLDS